MESKESDILSRARSYQSSKRLCIAMICDFFYPNTGGVEIHILNLAYCLIEKGHKVIGITHYYGDKIGVRYIHNGLKIYYCPFTMMPNGFGNIIFPLLHSPHMLPLLRDIFIREDVDLVHWHQGASQLGYYTALSSHHLNVRVILTNHSLWEIEDPFIIMLNKLHNMVICTKGLEHTISVSHAVRENEIIRADMPVQKTSVIPNAIDCNLFTADPSQRYPVGTINIVYVARLATRKGRLTGYLRC